MQRTTKNICVLALILCLVLSLVGCKVKQNNTGTLDIGNTTASQTTANDPVKKLGIPKISSRSQLLDNDWAALKIQLGNYLNGPQDSWKGIAQSNLYLQNINLVDCYFDISNKSDIIGVVDSEIVFYGTYGITQYAVKDIISDKALLTEPYTTSTGNEKSVYVWELENGYCMIVALSSKSLSWYNQKVFCVVHAKNLEYLAPINIPN